MREKPESRMPFPESPLTRKPKALDLFCGAGGASMGIVRAGFDVTGVDIKKQPNYPFTFIEGDALEQDLSGYDFVWASPPCQEHTSLRARTGKHYECFIERTRAKLMAWGEPWIMENVPGSPLLNPAVLCGHMFGLRVYRHRLFESSEFLMVPPHQGHSVQVNRRKTNRRAHWDAGGFVSVVGDIGSYVGPEAMGINWMTGNELSQAIPPAYAEFLCAQLRIGAVAPATLENELPETVATRQLSPEGAPEKEPEGGHPTGIGRARQQEVSIA